MELGWWWLRFAHTVVGVGVLHMGLVVAVVIDMEVENKLAPEADRVWDVLVVLVRSLGVATSCMELANWVVVWVVES